MPVHDDGLSEVGNKTGDCRRDKGAGSKRGQFRSFSHTRPDGSDAFTIFSQFGIPANYRGENLACGGSASPQKVMDLWIASEGHYSNIINPRFTRIGVGTLTSGKYGYWAQLFAN